MISVIRTEDMKPEVHSFTGNLEDALSELFPEGPGTQSWKIVHIDEDGNQTDIGVADGQGEVLARDVYVEKSDRVVIALSPGDPFTIQVLIAVAISVSMSVLTYLLTPRPPEYIGAPTPSDVYSVGVQANEAKPGGQIPIQYGEWMRSPQYASQPWLEFQDNKERAYFYFCLGMGEFQESSIKLFVGNTPLTELNSNDWSWWLFNPSDHGNSLGEMQKVTGIHENVYTSGEVASQELPRETGSNSQYDGVTFYVGNGGSTFAFNRNPAGIGISAGGTFTVSDSNAVEFFGAAYNVDGTYNVTSVNGTAVNVSNGPNGTGEFRGAITGSSAPSDPDTIGPFVSCLPGQETERIDLDFECPAGLFDSNDDGTLKSTSLTLYIACELLNDDDSGAGTYQNFTRTWSAASNDPQRRTYTFNVPKGRYAVSVRRNQREDGTGETTRVVWTRLKSFLSYDNSSVYGQTSILALALTSSAKLSSGASQRVQVKSKRLIRPLNGTGLSFNNSPADVVQDIFTNEDYSIARPDSELDFSSLQDFKSRHPDSFNGVFDSDTNVFDAIQSVLSLYNADPVYYLNKFGVSEDMIKPIRKMLFTPDSIIPGSLEVSMTLGNPDETDGVEVGYYDPVTYNRVFVRHPSNALRPQKVDAFGCTDKSQALAIAQRVSRSKQYRNMFVRFETEMEGRLVEFGDRIAVMHPNFSWGTDYLIVSAFTSTQVWFEEGHPPTGTYSLMLRDAYGNTAGPFSASVSQGGGALTLNSGSISGISSQLLDEKGVHASIVRSSDHDIIDIIVAKEGVVETSPGVFSIEGFKYDERVY